MRVKHVPMRTCLGTGEKFPKRELVRIVRTVDGRVVVDETGKAAGSRGAYVSKSLTALRTALTRKRIEAELECALSEGDRAALLEYFGRFEDRQSADRDGAAAAGRAGKSGTD